MRSPIEILIDKACGVTEEKPPHVIMLRCPVCKKSKVVEKDEYDPPMSVLQEFPCPHCRGPQDEVKWFNEEGEELK
jgi:uncharacterized protein YbaR (Trm112 family)